MSTGRPLRRRRGLVVVAVVVGVLGLAASLAFAFANDDDWLSFDDPTVQARSYFLIFLFVALDAVFPIFPAETTLNAASTAAAAGALDLLPIIVLGCLGAIAGDSALFAIARGSADRVRPRLEKARSNRRVDEVLAMMSSSAPVLIVAGRYLPGMRFVVNGMMGLSDIPYRRFLPWSILGGVLWSTYTCVLAYLIGTALAGFPLASIVISGLVTTVALAFLYVTFRHRRPARREEDTA
ncbi:MAG TPA: VTT domain-containing protein [Actinomycetes bacterium]|nr:VTT domain-containing protein [Actinomycetes bacterium]